MQRTSAFCSSVDQKPQKEPKHTLTQSHPEIAKEWHPTKNIDKTPDAVTAGSSHKAFFLCSSCGHEWMTRVHDRIRSKGCPNCSKGSGTTRFPRGTPLSEAFPELVKEWHPTMNDPSISPQTISFGSHQKVNWICPNGHVYESTVSSRSMGKGCPKCSGAVSKRTRGTSLLEARPDLAAQLHPIMNTVSAEEFSWKSNKKVYWQCTQFPDHVWLARASDRVQGNGCPFCAGVSDRNSHFPRGALLTQALPNLAGFFVRALDGTPLSLLTFGSQKMVEWRCPNGHSFTKAVGKATDSVLKGQPLCPFCKFRLEKPRSR